LHNGRDGPPSSTIPWGFLEVYPSQGQASGFLTSYSDTTHKNMGQINNSQIIMAFSQVYDNGTFKYGPEMSPLPDCKRLF